jgi:hypothetical protein
MIGIFRNAGHPFFIFQLKSCLLHLTNRFKANNFFKMKWFATDWGFKEKPKSETMRITKHHILELLTACMMLILSTSIVMAQGHENKKGMHGEQHEEMKAYMKEKIFPVVKEARQKLDQRLTAAEKDELEYIRKQFKGLMEEKRQMYSEMKDAEIIRDEQWQQMRKLYMEKHRLMAMTTEIAQEHEQYIYEVLKELDDDANIWRKDLKEMWEKKKEEMEQEKDKGKGKGRQAQKGKENDKGWHGHHKKYGRHHAGPLHLMDPVHFLLLDPEHMEEMMEEKE